MKRADGLVQGADGVLRCFWGAGDPLYRRYHDDEWGWPLGEDRQIFEKVCLDGFQAGLSWLTILRKRPAFRSAFRRFSIRAVARFGAPEIRRLLRDPGIVRHRGKIESAINNARGALQLSREFGSLAAYFWSFEPETASRPRRLTWPILRTMAQTPESVALSRDLKGRGWTYVGPTIVYAFMQAMGVVNDHLEGCAIRPRVEAARLRFRRSLRP